MSDTQTADSAERGTAARFDVRKLTPEFLRFTRIEPAGTFARSGRARFRGFKSYPLRVSA